MVNNRVESVRKKEKIDMFKIILLCFIIAATMILSGCGKNKKDGYGVTPSSDISSNDNSNSTGSDQTQNGGSHQQVDKKDLSSTKDDVINIREKVFLAQINDIYSNFED